MNKKIIHICLIAIIIPTFTHSSFDSMQQTPIINEEEINDLYKKLSIQETDEQPTLEEIVYTTVLAHDYLNFLSVFKKNNALPLVVPQPSNSTPFLMNDHIHPSLLKQSLLIQQQYAYFLTHQRDTFKQQLAVVQLQQAAAQYRNDWQKYWLLTSDFRKEQRNIAQQKKVLKELEPIIQRQNLFNRERKARQVIENKEQIEKLMALIETLRSCQKTI